MGHDPNRTNVVKNDLNPVWNQNFVFHGLSSESDLLEVRVMDDDSDEMFGKADNTLGEIKIKISDVAKMGLMEEAFFLGGRSDKSWTGALSMRLEWKPAP